jgi:DNA-binding MarR family transcriptional regulator
VTTPELDLPTLVSLAGPAVVRQLLARIADEGFAGVKPAHGYVMQRLVEGEPTINELADALGITQQGASKQVADLELLGYVARVAGDRDQRVRSVRLTPAGRALLAAGRRARLDLEAEVTRSVGADVVMAARTALVALLGLTDVAEHITDRSVPLPDPQ